MPGAGSQEPKAEMNVLFIGDIVGREAAEWFVGRLPKLRREHNVDLTIANAENIAVSAASPFKGFGMSVDLVEMLFAGGVDVITSGNHAWDGPDAEQVHAHPRVLRPLNLPEGRPGKGLITIQVAGEPVTIVNVADKGAIPEASPLEQLWAQLDLPGTVIVDFHGESTMQKHVLACALDGKVAAVLGTHTHEPTMFLHLSPGGTALVCDVGMTGRLGGVQGIYGAFFHDVFHGADPAGLPPYTLATGPLTLGAVLLRIAEGRAREIYRLG